MTEQERYLITFLNETFGHHESDIDSEAFSKRLIQRYPQILSEKVWKGRAIQVETIERSLMCNRVWRFKNGFDQNIEVFIREIKE